MILTGIGIAEAGITALLGYAVVFFGLILLMCVTLLLGRFFVCTAKKEAPKEDISASETQTPEAPGAAGQLKLHNVEPKTAALLMAIVADKMGKPINELRFLSIKEVEK